MAAVSAGRAATSAAGRGNEAGDHPVRPESEQGVVKLVMDSAGVPLVPLMEAAWSETGTTVRTRVVPAYVPRLLFFV